MSKYKVLIGLEMHAEITGTKSKVFSSAKNEYNVNPNVNVSPLDAGFPGTLPVVNKEAVRKALMASIIFKCKTPLYLYFERKNYYYPDLPKGYQITQETKPAPIGVGGMIEYYVGEEKKQARINNLHLEEDSASLEHITDASLVDYNRSGVPLLELVTEPDFTSAEEAMAFLETVKTIYQYAGISEADLKKGQVRADVNVSIMDKVKDANDPKNWGTKVEMKNVTFNKIINAINAEVKRQEELKEQGTYDEMPQQTRKYDEETDTTIFLRSKANAIDYKYFIEPNIPKFKITDEFLNNIKKEIPVLANERKEKYINKYGLKTSDANILIKKKEISDYYDACLEAKVDPVLAANWVNTYVLGSINKLNISLKDFFISPSILGELLKLVESGKIGKTQAKNAFYDAVENKKNPLDIIKENNIETLDNEAELEKIVDKILSEHEKQVNDYLNGATNVINFLLGLVMKETKGRADPAKTMELLKEKIK